ncbi:hypothetical protein Hanom_Chr02g00129271 [Helianthus anomalus]
MTTLIYPLFRTLVIAPSEYPSMPIHIHLSLWFSSLIASKSRLILFNSEISKKDRGLILQHQFVLKLSSPYLLNLLSTLHFSLASNLKIVR